MTTIFVSDLQSIDLSFLSVNLRVFIIDSNAEIGAHVQSEIVF